MSLGTIGNIANLNKKFGTLSNKDDQKQIAEKIGKYLKGKSYEKASSILKSSGAVNEDLKEIALNAAGIQKPAEEATSALAGLGNTSIGLSKLKGVITGLGSTIKTAAMAHPILATIAAITGLTVAGVTLYKKFHKSQAEYIKDGEKAQDTIDESTSSLKTNQSKLKSLATTYKTSSKEIKNHEEAIDSLAKSYSDLYKGVDKNTNENRTLSTDDYQNYLDLSNELAQTFPDLVSGYDEQGNAILDLGTNAKNAAEDIRTLYDAQRLASQVTFEDNLQSVYEGIKASVNQKIAENASLKKRSEEKRTEADNIEQQTIDVIERLKNNEAVNFGEIDNGNAVLDRVLKVFKDYGISTIDKIIGDASTGHTFSPMIEDTEKLSQALKGLQSDLNQTATAAREEANQMDKTQKTNDLYIKDQWKTMSNYLGQYLQTTDSFSSLQDSIQDAFTANIQNLDLSKLMASVKDGGYDGQVMDFLYSEFITPMSQISEEAQDTLTKALQIDPSKLNLSTYQSQIKEALEKAFPDDKDSQDLFSKALGFDQAIKDASDTAVKLKNIATQHVTDIKQTLGKLTNMTNGDKEIAYDIIANDDFSGTFAELSALVEKAKKETSETFDINATPYMDKVEKALESENAGQNYDKITGYIKQAVELYNSGKVGTDDFKSIAALISPTGSDDVANFEENIGKAMRYFTEDSTGAKNFLADLENLDKGYVQLNEDTNQYKISIDDLQKAASDMGMSFETFMASLKNTSDYGFTNDFFATEEEGLNHLSQLYKERDQAQMQLEELSNQPAWKKVNNTAIDEAKKKLEEYNQRIENTKDLINTLGEKTATDYDNEISAAKQVLKSNLKEWLNIDPNSNNAKEIKKRMYDDMQSLADTYGIDLGSWFKYDDKGNVIGIAESIWDDVHDTIDKKPLTFTAKIGDDVDVSKTQIIPSNDGKYAVLVNPVLPDGTELTDDNIQKIVNDALAGSPNEQVLGVFDGDQAEQTANRYKQILNAVDEASHKTSTDIANDFATLKEYTQEDLGNITFGDGQYQEGLENAESAIDDILSKLNLSQEDASTLIDILSKLGLINVDIEADNPEQPIEEAQTYADSNPVVVSYEVDDSALSQPHYQSTYTQLSGVEWQPGTATTMPLPEQQQVIYEQKNETVKYDVEAPNPEHVREQVQSDLDANPAKVTVEFTSPSEKPLAGLGLEDESNGLSINVKMAPDTSEVDSSVKDIESTSATKKVDGDTTNLDNKVSTSVSNIEGTTAIKPVDANTDPMEQSIENALNKPHTITVQANVQYTAGSSTLAGIGLTKANGTPFIKSGHFNDGRLGTFGRAFAQGGTVGEPRDTRALLAETAPELLVRNNRFYLVGKNGPEMKDLKKGDIVFNPQQTKELLSKGKTHTRGRALAQGNVGDARLGGSSGFGGFSGGAAGKKIDDNGNITSNDSSSSTTANTKATNANTKATNSNTSAKEKSTQVFDWVSKRLTVLSDAVQRTADTITDYVSSAFKAKQLKKEIKQIDAQINGNKKGAAAYLAKAEEVAKAYKYKDDNGNEQTVSVSDEYKRKVRNGEWSIEDMDTNDTKSKAMAEAIQKYQEYYEKFEDCNDAIQGLYNTQLDLYSNLCQIPLDEAAKKVEKFTNAITNLSATADIAGSGTSGIATYQKILKQRKQGYQKKTNADLEASKEILGGYGGIILTALTSKDTKINSKTGAKIANTIQQGKNLSASQIKALKKAGLGTEAINYTNKWKHDSNLKSTAKSRVNSNFTKAEQMVLGYDSKKTASYKLQNALVTEQVKEKKRIMNTNFSAAKKTKATMESDKMAYNYAKANSKKKANNILSNKKFKLTASQKKSLKADEKVDLTGVTDSTLLSYLKSYNSSVDSRKSAYSKYKISKGVNEEAQQKAQESTTDYAQASAEAPITKLENTKNWHEAKISSAEVAKSKADAEVSLKQSKGYDLDNADYMKQINANKEIEKQKAAERDALKKQLESSGLDKNSEEYKKWDDQIVQLDTDIKGLQETNHGLYDDMRNNGYKVFERMYDASEKLRKSYSAIKDLINDDMTFDDDGKFTNAGLVSLDQTMKTYQSNQQDLDTALKQRQSYIDRFNAVNEDGTKKYPEYSQQEFDNDMQNVTTTIQESIAATNASRQEAINMIAAQAKAELDALNKVIDARKEALQKKEEYYEYDKKIKSQTNDLKSLDAQINALEGVQTEEGRAQKARLEAQRKESQESLDDTVIQHQYDMQINGLSDLSNQLQENYETYVKELNRNFDTANKQLDAVNRYLDANQGIIQKAANEIIKGVTGKDIDFSNLSYKSDVWYSEPSKKARGDRRVNSDQIAITQEKGEEMIMYKGGLITPLHAGDTVFNHTLTERLYDMAQNYPNLMSVPSVTRSTDADNIAPVISCPITINGNANEQDVINAVNKMMPQINKSVTTAIRADLRKAH
ncbi:ATPase involved in DNA repair [uncultured Clostridium sp.]|nr:ATPase involved in DNA repair [uncultured Clostridium sp.]